MMPMEKQNYAVLDVGLAHPAIEQKLTRLCANLAVVKHVRRTSVCELLTTCASFGYKKDLATETHCIISNDCVLSVGSTWKPIELAAAPYQTIQPVQCMMWHSQRPTEQKSTPLCANLAVVKQLH